MAIVTLTRQAGSFGDEIGMLIARRLGYTFYDKHEIERRIIAKGLPKEEFLSPILQRHIHQWLAHSLNQEIQFLPRG